MKGLYGEADMKSDNVKDKDSKIVFLQKAIDVVILVSGELLAAKPARIVAGHEPEKTNELLQVIAKCCLSKLSSDEAVRRVLAGDKVDQKGKTSTSRSQDKENREGRERHRDRESLAVVQERKGIKESSGSREQKDPDQPKDQESKRDDKDHRRDAERSDKGRERDRTKDRDKDKSRDREKDKTREKEREKEKDHNRDKERERDKERDKKRERESHRDRERDKERDREKRREREKEKERHRETGEKLKDRGDRKIKVAEEISKPKPHPEVASKTHEAKADEAEGGELEPTDLSEIQAESPSRIPRPSSAKGQRRWPKTGGQDETDSEGEGEAPSAEKPVPIENGDITDSVPPQTTQRRLPRPNSARPAAPRVKRQESYTDHVTPAERLGSGKTLATVILDGKKLSEDEDDEDGLFEVEEAAAPPPDILEVERNSLELQGNDKHGGLVKKILETKKDYESSPATKSKEQDRSLVSESSRKKERELVAKEIERLRSSIQTVCRSALPLGKIMDYIQEDMDSMQNELQTWRKENKENAQALLQEQRITDSIVEPLKTELTELEQLIKDQQDKICTVKSNILKNEEKIQKMVSSISFSSQT
ncbi:TRAF3-interacting protein 1 isoform X1 [Sinocyclocheilus grahami]|uniref:TRAF3-interacting protein 1 isoform X1 n=1 Tax=Sinocyclocheilus grahami TaxID=75366 RepID=UPI0007AC8593|nr:PREDICTED: TRAF3-interacting protein 1-like isoform X1 [Sinocyclocheilus grahami]